MRDQAQEQAGNQSRDVRGVIDEEWLAAAVARSNTLDLESEKTGDGGN